MGYICHPLLFHCWPGVDDRVSFCLAVEPVGDRRDQGLWHLDVVAELVRSSKTQDVVVGLEVLGVAQELLGGKEVDVHFVH